MEPKVESSERTSRKPPDEWDIEARTLIEVEIKRRRVSYEKLSEDLNGLGYDQVTPKSLAQRVQRGGFSFAFALRLLRVLKLDALDMSYVELHSRRKQSKSRTGSK